MSEQQLPVQQKIEQLLRDMMKVKAPFTTQRIENARDKLAALIDAEIATSLENEIPQQANKWMQVFVEFAVKQERGKIRAWAKARMISNPQMQSLDYIKSNRDLYDLVAFLDEQENRQDGGTE